MVSELNDRKNKIKLEISENQKNWKELLPQRAKFTKSWKYKKRMKKWKWAGEAEKK